MSVAACGPLILHASQVSARVGWRVVGDWALDSGKFRLRERCACVVGTPGPPTARASLHMHGMCRGIVKAATQEGVFSPERSGKRACETVCVTARLERAPSLNRRPRIPVFAPRAPQLERRAARHDQCEHARDTRARAMCAVASVISRDDGHTSVDAIEALAFVKRVVLNRPSAASSHKGRVTWMCFCVARALRRRVAASLDATHVRGSCCKSGGRRSGWPQEEEEAQKSPPRRSGRPQEEEEEEAPTRREPE